MPEAYVPLFGLAGVLLDDVSIHQDGDGPDFSARFSNLFRCFSLGTRPGPGAGRSSPSFRASTSTSGSDGRRCWTY